MTAKGRPALVISCSVAGCPNRTYTAAATPRKHGAAMRRAIQDGWRGTGEHGCICADSEQRCPGHAS